jgi:hypothetical protein
MSNLLSPMTRKKRYQNTRGAIIPMHHAFLTIEVTPKRRTGAVLMALAFALLVWALLPALMSVWKWILEFWTSFIYDGVVAISPIRLLGQDLAIPYPALIAADPSSQAVYINLVVCVLAFLCSFLIPPRLAPMNYLLRAVLLVQSSASIARILLGDFFPYTLQTYIADSLVLSAWLMFVVPLVLGFIYYIFEFSLLQKVLVTVGTLLYYTIAIPCLYMLHACIIYAGTLIMLPLMYFVFGTLLNVLMFVCFYAYAMSLRGAPEDLHGRGS